MKSIFLLTVLFCGLAQASEPFGAMTCKKVISDEIYLKTKSDDLTVKWVTRGGEGETKLLRALADEKIPTSLLKAYGDLRIHYTVPLSSCEFGKKLGHFACQHAGEVEIRVEAKLSPYDYDVEPDVYEGVLSKVTLKSSFSGKADSRYLEFPMGLEVESPKAAKVTAKTDFFFAHHWDYDGFGQDPSCLVDNVPLVD